MRMELQFRLLGLLAALALLLVRTSTASPLNLTSSILRARLSKNATVLDHKDAGFAAASARWTTYSGPTFSIVVEVATEQDVAETVAYASSRGIPFLAQSGGHGYSTTLSSIQDGIMVSLRRLSHTHYDNATAKVQVGGGIKSGDLAQAVHQYGRELPLGDSGCTGALGVALGGGHNPLQGKWGLLADSLDSARLVLHNGSILDVSAATHADLWWALRGAGQNYGVVVSAVFRTHPQTPGGLHYQLSGVYAADKIELLLPVLEALRLVLPRELAIYLAFTSDPDTLQPIIRLRLLYAGPRSAALPFVEPLLALNFTSHAEDVVPWPRLLDASASTCAKGFRKSIFAANMATLDARAVLRVWRAWAALLRRHPDAASTVLGFDVLPQQGVLLAAAAAAAGGPHAAGAVPFRARSAVLAVLGLQWTDDALLPALDAAGRSMRAALREGAGYARAQLPLYQNYGRGDEPLRALYGYDEGALAELARLKREYDPREVFSAYHGIPLRW
ncbi:hypothetical protein B0J12DRAFT_782609 [Macrophomina phaseolina]|uniref:FAD-binding PCMH-type domain-containing protein n=1 Tax=Macrophomina phaseolina TaxID=35725 RepID=A0ABQ8GLL0_9PEZI|nr:hypothetical protein B0J12DRAFT_782609 [Macrophomina phaseolina]